MAVPANLSDPLLKKWVKPQSNPFLLQVRQHLNRIDARDRLQKCASNPVGH
jgi:hypothetical protein